METKYILLLKYAPFMSQAEIDEMCEFFKVSFYSSREAAKFFNENKHRFPLLEDFEITTQEFEIDMSWLTD